MIKDEKNPPSVVRPETGPEDLSIIRTAELPSQTYLVATEVKGKRKEVKLSIPSVRITSNVPSDVLEEDISLNKDIHCFGFSSARHKQSREELEGGPTARVAVFDYADVGRVIMLNSPAPRSLHPPADAMAHVVCLDEEGTAHFSGIIADGNSSVYIPSKMVFPEIHQVLEVNKKTKQALITAFASARYADLAARNVFRLPAFEGAEELYVDLLVTHLEAQKRLYLREYGGSTVQIVNASFGFNSEAGELMTLNALNLGHTEDLGSLSLHGSPHGRRNIDLLGNKQDLSFQAKLLDYKASSLVKSLSNTPVEPVVLQLTSDGIDPLPDTLSNGLDLLQVLGEDPETIIRYLQSLDYEDDDASLMFFIPYHLLKGGTQAAEAVSVLDQPSDANSEEVAPRNDIVLQVPRESMVEIQETPKETELQNAIGFFIHLMGEERFHSLVAEGPEALITGLHSDLRPLVQRLDNVRVLLDKLFVERIMDSLTPAAIAQAIEYDIKGAVRSRKIPTGDPKSQ